MDSISSFSTFLTDSSSSWSLWIFSSTDVLSTIGELEDEDLAYLQSIRSLKPREGNNSIPRSFFFCEKTYYQTCQKIGLYTSSECLERGIDMSSY